MRKFGGMTRPERFAASTEQISPLPIPLPLQNEVVDERRLLTVPWVSLFQWLLNIGTRTFLSATHAERVDPDGPYDPAQYRPGTWFWETDRTVLYQVRIVSSEPRWVYVLGTMEAPLASRPTDLGPYDAGFQFASTDTGQLYYWDGAVWVDITAYPVTLYGTHAQRLAHSTATLTDGALWCETDRGNALYQLQSGVWWYVSGTMFGTLSPDQRPADLGVPDAGFEFRTSVAPSREFIWSQTAWVEVASQTGSAQTVKASGPVTLTGTWQPVPGANLNLSRTGWYWLHAVYDFQVTGAGDAGQLFYGGISVAGALLPSYAQYAGAAAARGTVSQQWLYQALTPGELAYVASVKGGGTGTSTCQTETTLVALWVSN